MGRPAPAANAAETMDALSRAEFVLLAILALACCAALTYALIELRRVRATIGESGEAPPPRTFALTVPLVALLPLDIPIVDGLRLSASYVPGSGTNGGGDFYDVFFLDDESVAVTIGDAAGHGLGAVTAMNVVRQAMRSAFYDGARPAEVLRRANRVLLRSGTSGIVTAIAAIVEPATLQLRYACAGHAPPLLATDAGSFTTLPGPATDLPLGAITHHVTTEQNVTLPVDGLLAFYTDGFTAGDVAARTQAFGEALVAARTLRPTKPAAAIDRAIFGDRERSDDAAILTIAPEPTLEHVDVRLPAESASTALARSALRRFFAGTTLDERRTYDALVAVGEAVSNAIEHAYAGRPNQTFSVRARYEGAKCAVFVEDGGAWRQPDAEPSGRGVAMMRALSDECSIERGANGTTVVLRFLLAPRLADVALVDSAIV